MGKKRRVRRIVGSFVLLMLAFGIVASIAESQTDRLQREVQAVVRDYGFVEEDRGPWLAPEATHDLFLVYGAKGLDEGDIERIAERFDSACTGCRETGGAMETVWRFAEFEPNDLRVAVANIPRDGVVTMFVLLNADDTGSPWDRLRSWWPW